MTMNEYQQDMLKTTDTSMSQEKAIRCGCYGLNGEAGEAIDVLKKHEFQGHPFDARHMALEIGDVLFYVAQEAWAIGYTLDEIAWMNVKKRQNRYPDGFDPERSLNREETDI